MSVPKKKFKVEQSTRSTLFDICFGYLKLNSTITNKNFKNWHSSSNKETLVMGVINVTPDSFSDGGKYLSIKNATERAQALLEEGADILDIGGESTRPGAKPVDVSDELIA